MTRAKGQPFREDDPKYGPVYHVGGPADMVRLLETEHGLGWTAHPRIKASNFTPDAYRDEPFYRSDVWLGAAWKAMPADLSSPRLGRRVLDLLRRHGQLGPEEVRARRGRRLQDRPHPRALRPHERQLPRSSTAPPGSKTTGRPCSTPSGTASSSSPRARSCSTTSPSAASPAARPCRSPPTAAPRSSLDLEWTFPMRFAEVISGDGEKVYRDRIDLSDGPAVRPSGRHASAPT